MNGWPAKKLAYVFELSQTGRQAARRWFVTNRPRPTRDRPALPAGPNPDSGSSDRPTLRRAQGRRKAGYSVAKLEGRRSSEIMIWVTSDGEFPTDPPRPTGPEWAGSVPTDQPVLGPRRDD